MIRRVLALAAAVAVSGAITMAQVGMAQAEKLMLGRTFGVSQLPGLIAETKGFFKEQGLDVEYKSVSRGNVALGAMASGTLHFAESAHAPFLAAVSRDAPFVGVGIACRGFQGNLVAAPKNAGLKSLADFKGKRVGIQVGTGVHTVILMLLERQGLNADDFQFTNLRVVDMPAAMAAPNNSFDAVIGWNPFMQRIVQGGHGKLIVPAKTFEDQAKITYPFLISTTKTYLKEHPDVVQKVINAYAKGHKYIRDHKEEAVKIYTADIQKRGGKLTEDMIRLMLFDTDRYGGAALSEADMADLTATRDFLFKAGKLKAKPDFANVINRSFGSKGEKALTN
jgi:ABC-type nitrate/sulfonate/bicarbonate transport system substrate-binding protein